MTNLNKKQGFSLIELSIVLIIIGLLIAGVTGGASLIKTAELRSVITEARGLDVSVNAYYAARDQLPGDADTTVASADYAAGDANGQIEFINSANVNEGQKAFEDMLSESVAEKKPETALTGSAISDGTSIAKANLVDAKLRGASWVIDNMTIGGIANRNGVLISKPGFSWSSDLETSATVAAGNAAIGDADARSLDAKMDDGEKDTGKVSAIGSACDYSGTAESTCNLAIALSI